MSVTSQWFVWCESCTPVAGVVEAKHVSGVSGWFVSHEWCEWFVWRFVWFSFILQRNSTIPATPVQHTNHSSHSNRWLTSLQPLKPHIQTRPVRCSTVCLHARLPHNSHSPLQPLPSLCLQHNLSIVLQRILFTPPPHQLLPPQPLPCLRLQSLSPHLHQSTTISKQTTTTSLSFLSCN